MKQIVIGLISGLATAAALLAGAPAYADPLDGWVKAVNKKLDRAVPIPTSGRHGVAEATFERGEDGRAKAIVVRSDDRALARAARITLARVRGLPALPAGFKGARIRMQMLIGDFADPFAYYAQRKQMLATAQASNARLDGDEVRFAALDRR